MGFIDAVRAWLFGADDDPDDAGEPGDETEGSGGEDDASERDESDGLDPAAATETRTATATDDAVDALRDVRKSQETAESREEEGGGPATAQTGGDAEAPDDDRTKPSDEGGTNR